MKILVNGSENIVEDGLSAQQLIQVLGLTNQKYAMEVNEVIIPRSEYLSYMLKAGDNVEIIHAIGGG